MKENSEIAGATAARRLGNCGLLACLVAVLAWCMPALAATAGNAGSLNQQQLKRWSELPSQELLERGNDYALKLNRPDNALACFTIVASRYNKSNSDKEKRNSVNALLMKWYVYFNFYYDYSKAYECLMRADEIAQPYPRLMQLVYLNFGNMFQTMGDIGHDNRQYQIAASYYNKIMGALGDSTDAVVNIAMTNLITTESQLGALAKIAPQWKRYAQLRHRLGDYMHDYCVSLYKGSVALSQGHYEQAASIFSKQFQSLQGSDVDRQRLRFIALGNLAKAQESQQLWPQAIATLHQAEALAESIDLKDGCLEAYDRLERAYKKMGDTEHCDAYRNKYFALKDSLLNDRQLMTVNGLHISYQMKKYDEQQRNEQQQRQVQRIALWSGVAIIAVVLIFALVIYGKNRRLSRLNETLYSRTREIMSYDEELRRQASLMQLKLDELQTDKGRQALEPEIAPSTKPEPADEAKYSNSNLDDDEKELLMIRLREVMEKSDEIYSPDFSLERLAQLVGSRYRYISQVINEKYHKNFATFLNEYRIKEACRRIGDQDTYGQLTLEAISQSVGFKSRSSFIAAFKRTTGLTPSVYMRIARRQQQ